MSEVVDGQEDFGGAVVLQNVSTWLEIYFADAACVWRLWA